MRFLVHGQRDYDPSVVFVLGVCFTAQCHSHNYDLPSICGTHKQTPVFENNFGTYTYRNIKSDLNQGSTISKYPGIPNAKATVAKVLFDYFYFCPLNGDRRLATINLAEDLRLNLEDFSRKDRVEFHPLLNRMATLIQSI